ncbi:MAG: hydrogenase 2 operon protein HybA [Candidatus Marinimicrobia bacterium]|nr:hydrogenase 2 operon protein HybA [Candidatus Neomarinimicrobiota bacterium]
MDIGRRSFFKVLSAGAMAVAVSEPIHAREAHTLDSDAMGILYDATLCIGCKACEVACKNENNMPTEHDTPAEIAAGVSGIWDSGGDLNAKTLNKIKVYKNGSALHKDQEIDGYSFIKRACMHCVDPACVSACPATALTKTEGNGIVKWNADACIGCRYCQIACPFNIPKFEWDDPTPAIVKCELCSHKTEKGGLPGCTEKCPTGASLFGKTKDLLKEAERRMSLKAGESYNYPVKSLYSNETQSHVIAEYNGEVYGDKEGGGTQNLYLAGVGFDKLGLPDLPEYSAAKKSETLQHRLYKGMIAPAILLGGLVTAAYKTSKSDEEGSEV